jgi:dTDP-4-dehydrorhamnose 3,5-epimerase-like enzyme
LKPEQIPLSCHVDDRGFLNQIYGDSEAKFPSVKRIYVVGNFAEGTIRGFHKHQEEWKSYFVCNGAAKFLVVDEDKNISTYILSPRNPSLLIVPPTYYHGWKSLEANTILVGMSNKNLDDSLRDDSRIDPFAFGKEVWEVKPR